MRILGTKFFGIDSSIFVIDTKKKKVFGISTERITRNKHDWYPILPILQKFKISNIDCVSHSFGDFDNNDTCVETKGGFIILLNIFKIYRRFFPPKLKKRTQKKKLAVYNEFFKNVLINLIKKILHTFLALSPEKNKSLVNNFIVSNLKAFGINNNKIIYFDHHLCHAASAYYFSPFAFEKDALSLTLDGQGDGYFSKLFRFNNENNYLVSASKSQIFKYKSVQYVTSIGEIYGNFTEALGYIRNSDEGKVEALAAYGKPDPELYNLLTDSCNITESSISFSIDKIKLFYDQTFLKKNIKVLGKEAFAATIQKSLEDIIVIYLNKISKKHSVKNLCLSGGVAANIIMSLNIYERTPFKNIYVFPAMSDDGTAAGAAILSALKYKQDISWLKKEQMPYFGNSYSKSEVEKTLKLHFKKINYEDIGSNWPLEAAKALSNNKIIAIFQGKMEFGPRALGNRSILANPMDPKSRDRINSTVKRRPWFQPFCPSILEDERERLFSNSFQHKHMAIAFRLKKEFHRLLPCAIHIDGTARPQFVTQKDNINYYKLIKEFKSISGFGVVINTSFNLHGRTMVLTPNDAVIDFIDCNIDELFIEGFKVTLKS